MKVSRFVFSLILTLLALDVLLFGYAAGGSGETGFYFLNVGEGDSELVRMPGGVDILIDGGLPNGAVIRELEGILPFYDRYIDIVVMSHAQADHFGGLIDVFERYKIGAFVWNGVKGTAQSLADLEKEIMKQDTKVIELAAGDRIRCGSHEISVLWPAAGSERETDINETSLVLLAQIDGARALFTGCLLYTSPSPRDLSTSRMPSSA